MLLNLITRMTNWNLGLVSLFITLFHSRTYIEFLEVEGEKNIIPFYHSIFWICDCFHKDMAHFFQSYDPHILWYRFLVHSYKIHCSMMKRYSRFLLSLIQTFSYVFIVSFLLNTLLLLIGSKHLWSQCSLYLIS